MPDERLIVSFDKEPDTPMHADETLDLSEIDFTKETQAPRPGTRNRHAAVLALALVLLLISTSLAVILLTQSPAAVWRNYARAMNNHAWGAAAEYLTSDTLAAMRARMQDIAPSKLPEQAIIPFALDVMNKAGTFSLPLSAEVIKVQRRGRQAVVTVHVPAGSPPAQYILEREGLFWKVDMQQAFRLAPPGTP